MKLWFRRKQELLADNAKLLMFRRLSLVFNLKTLSPKPLKRLVIFLKKIIQKKLEIKMKIRTFVITIINV